MAFHPGSTTQLALLITALVPSFLMVACDQWDERTARP